MEEFRINKAFRASYYFFITIIVIGLLVQRHDPFSLGFFIILLLLFIAFMSPRISLDDNGIVEHSLFQSRSTSFAEIASMSIKVNPLFIWSMLRYKKYYLQLEKKDGKGIKIVRIYAYEGCERLLDLLEEKTGKKIDGRRPAKSPF